MLCVTFCNDLHRLLIEYSKDQDIPAWKGYFYACLLFIATMTQSLVLQHYFIRCFVLGMNLKTSVISIVYNKVCICVPMNTACYELCAFIVTAA